MTAPTQTEIHPERIRAIGYAERATFYDFEHADTIDQPFLARLARTADGLVVEVPCGTGRNLALLAATGNPIIGIDLEPAMVAAARRTIGSTPDAEVWVDNMRWFSPPVPARLILVPREAFQLLPTYADALAALRNMRAGLRCGGTLMLDLATFAAGAEDQQHLHPSYFDPHIGDEYVVRDWKRDTPEGTLERWHWQRQRQDAAVTVGYHYRLRGQHSIGEHAEARIRLLRYTRPRLLALLAQAGLQVRGLLGDYEGREYRDGSPRLIVLATPGSG